MPKRAPNLIIVFLLLVSATLCSVPPAGAWFCEGKQCGVTLWGCCCASLSALGDANCGADGPNVPRADAETTLCAADCGCTVVIAEASDCDHTLPPSVTPFEPFAVAALLPAPVAAYVAPALTEIAVGSLEARGPPLRQTAFASPCLRAPPAA